MQQRVDHALTNFVRIWDIYRGCRPRLYELLTACELVPGYVGRRKHYSPLQRNGTLFLEQRGDIWFNATPREPPQRGKTHQTFGVAHLAPAGPCRVQEGRGDGLAFEMNSTRTRDSNHSFEVLGYQARNFTQPSASFGSEESTSEKQGGMNILLVRGHSYGTRTQVGRND